MSETSQIPTREFIGSLCDSLFTDETALSTADWLQTALFRTPAETDRYITDHPSGFRLGVLNDLVSFAESHQEWERYQDRRRKVQTITPGFIVPGFDSGTQRTRLHICPDGESHGRATLQVNRFETTMPPYASGFAGPLLDWDPEAGNPYMIIRNQNRFWENKIIFPEDPLWQGVVKTVVAAHLYLEQL